MAAFKDFFDAAYVARLGAALSASLLDADAFVGDAGAALETLELKDRVGQIADALHAHLRGSYAAKLTALRALLPPARPFQDGLADFDPSEWRGMAVWPLVTVVERHGLGDWDASFAAMEELTQRFSAEFAVRPFVIADAEQAYARMGERTAHPSEHVRRWASEGTRPRLPWGQRLDAAVADPSDGLRLLERLVDDESTYVRRSVANHLNDVSKDHPALAVEVAARWLHESPSRDDIVRHALRGLVKAGDPAALSVLGYSADVQARVEALRCDPSVRIGASLAVSCEVWNDESAVAPMVVDYAVHLVKANGSRSPKVFKWRVADVKPGKALRLKKAHSFKPVTTRRAYPGTHAVEVLVNGVSRGLVEFELLPAD